MRWPGSVGAACVSLVIVVGSQAHAVTTTTELVSVDVDGGEANRFSSRPSISADGRFIAFESYANDLVDGDGNHLRDVFVRDMLLATTVRASVDTDGGDPDAESTKPSISADGRYVAFESSARDLVVEDSNRVADIFVRDLVAGTTVRATIGIDGRDPNDESFHAAMSAEGGHVAFASRASNLVAGDGNGGYDVFVRDLGAGVTTRVSVDREGGDPNGLSSSPSISADGRYVAFDSEAADLVTGDGTIGWPDVFVRDVAEGTTVRASVDRRGGDPSSTSRNPSLSADGRYVAFQSNANDLVDGDHKSEDIFVRDLVAGTTVRATVDNHGQDPNGDSEEASISADGRFVAFESDANDLVPVDDNHVDVFVRDLTTATTTWVSLDRLGGQSNDNSYGASISSDGRYVAFYSSASDLVRNDGNDHQDVFIRRMPRGPTG